jgi:hypothetical protein
MSHDARTANWREDHKIRKLLHDAPTRALAEIEEGVFVRITGVVQPLHDKVLVAPLSGRRCVYYVLEVRKHLRMMSSLRVFEDDAKVPFILEANGNSVVVDPASALISAGFDYEASSDDSRGYAALVHFGLVGFADKSTFHEAILGIGEPVTLYGVGARERVSADYSGERNYRDDLEVPLLFAHREESPLVIRDDLDSL